MEAVGAVASVITLVGVAKASVKGLAFLEEIRETQNDYRLLRREIESIESAARSAERICSLTNNPQSIEDQINNQQLLRVTESLQDIVDDLTSIQLRCARDRQDEESEAKKRKWLRHKTRLCELQRQGQSVKMDLMLVYHGHMYSQVTQMTQITKEIEAKTNLRPDLIRQFQDLVAERGYRLTIAPREPPITAATVDGNRNERSLVAADHIFDSATAPVSSPTTDHDTEHVDAELMAAFRANGKLGCSKSCRCRCHGRPRYFQSQPWMRALLGSWTGSYHQSWSPRGSDTARCDCSDGRARVGPWWVEYQTPLVYWIKALQIRVQYDNATGLQHTIRFARYVPYTSPEWHLVDYSFVTIKQRIKARLLYPLPDDRDEKGMELLEYIIALGSLDLLEFVLKLWQGILRTGLSRQTRFAICNRMWGMDMGNRHHQTLSKLLSRDSDGDEVGNIPSPLHEAVRSGQGLEHALMQREKEMKLNGDSGDPINDLDEVGLAPLHHAAIRGDVNAVQHLVDAGANVNVKDRHQWTPLIRAAAEGHVDCMRVLIRASCLVDERSSLEETALHNAAWYCQTDAIRLLLKHGARASAKDMWGHTPLHNLSLHPTESTTEAAKLLLGATDVDMDALNNSGQPAVFLSVYHRNTFLLRCLVSVGASLAQIDIYSRGLLHYAAAFANSEALLFLHEQELSAVSASIDTELINTHGDTAWDDFIFCLTAPTWQLLPQWRRPNEDDISSFILLYQGVRDRKLKHAISVLERALEAMTLDNIDYAAELIAELARLRARCHNHTAAGFYRGMHKEVQVKGQAAAFVLEEEVGSLREDLSYSLQDEIDEILCGMMKSESEDTHESVIDVTDAESDDAIDAESSEEEDEET